MIDDKDFFALRLRHFIKGYRARHKLTQDAFAKKTQMTRSTLARIESESENKIAHTIETLSAFAKLEHGSLSNFFSYLCNAAPSSKDGQLFPWQKITLEALSNIKQSLRLDLVNVFDRVDRESLEEMIALVINIARLKKSQRECVKTVVDELRELTHD